MDTSQTLRPHHRWVSFDARTQFETAETVRLGDGSIGRLTEFSASLESDGSWRFKSKYRSSTSGTCRVSIRRTM